jgi:hypothetical protein
MRYIKPKITAYILLFFILHTICSPTHSHPKDKDNITKTANEIIKTINNLLTHRKSDFVKHNLNNLNSQKKLSTKLIRRLNNANKISSTIDIKKFYLLFEDQRKNLEKILNEVEKEPDGDALIAGLIYTYPSDIKGENNPIWNFFQFGYNKPADHTSP